MKITKESLEITQIISEKINNQTFHHHYHILYDIAKSFNDDKKIIYLEIGCYAGGSACLLLQRPYTKVISIDLGYPISKKIVEDNVNNLNIHKNEYFYIEGNSNHIGTIKSLEEILNGEKIDILFIDGDHTFSGVLSDFEKYEKFVNNGGYVVFDDYADYKYSPDVKRAVDYLIDRIDNYEILGAFGKEFGARGECPTMSNESYDRNSNEFVIRKKS
jgi:cephalosporin hydroxylase